MEIKIAIKQLVEFLLRSGDIDSRFTGTDRALQGAKIHRRLQKQAGPSYKAEVSLSVQIEQGDILYSLYGRADGLIEGEKTVIDEIKTVSVPLDEIDENYSPAHWAQAKCYGYIICKDNDLQDIEIRLTYFNIDSEDIKYLTKTFSKEELENDLHKLLAMYEKWAILSVNWAQKREQSLKQLTFPFSNYRTGQRTLAVGVYNTIKTKDRLFVCAPTGIGKTMSTIFPSLKAVGEGYGDKIFYLTAKTLTASAVTKALEKLNFHFETLQLKTLFITAKDKICPMETRQCNPEVCPYAKGYFDKINDAVYEIIQNEKLLNREKISEIAKERSLCPYELGLDLSLWCDMIVCDYNYLFDPVVKLQRYFDGKGGDYIFLIDEAHNLPDRAREMYSAQLDKKSFFEVKKTLDKKEKKLTKALSKVNNAFIELRHLFDDKEDNQLVIKEFLSQVEVHLYDFTKACGDYFDKHKNEPAPEELLKVYFDAKFFLKIAEDYDDTYVSILTKYHDNIVLRLYCLDPSGKIDQCLDKGRSGILFSATLSPLPYYKQLMGDKGNYVSLPSPFLKDNFGLIIADKISTKYAHRQDSIWEIAYMLSALTLGKSGNYLAYFPSYAYMNSVYEAFKEEYPNIKTIIQAPNMQDFQREEFMAAFDTQNSEGLLGFCVLGGIYGEGIDLVGEKLIGCAVIGVGLAQINTQLDVLKDYYSDKAMDGFAFAYQYPGMNKVMQAAGRVIRTSTDKGVVLLIDSRFNTLRYKNLMPEHWSHYETAKNSEKLSLFLKKFWNK